MALSAPVGKSVNNGRYENLVGVRVRPDGTDMDIGSIEPSDPGQKPVLGKVG